MERTHHKFKVEYFGWSIQASEVNRILLAKILRRVKNRFYGVPMRVSAGRNLSYRKGSSVIFGENVGLGDRNSVTAVGGSIVFGNNFKSNEQVLFNADIGGTLRFGDDCLVGPGCIFRTSNHVFSNTLIPIRKQGHTHEDIIIGNDVWIGARALILPGVSIGDGCVVGAGAVVTQSFEAYSILAGMPARVIGSRLS